MLRNSHGTVGSYVRRSRWRAIQPGAIVGSVQNEAEGPENR